jgi:uncharacterized protein (UPF0262 family)
MIHTPPHNRIEAVILDDATLGSVSAKIRHEREVVTADLIADNNFSLQESQPEGPYSLHLALSENRLLLDVSASGQPATRVTLPLKPLRAIIRDYFLICESYTKVLEASDPRKVEAIDMGRRGVHNEGSELLKELLQPEITVDFDTARRLFSLICVLHMKG